MKRPVVAALVALSSAVLLSGCSVFGSTVELRASSYGGDATIHLTLGDEVQEIALPNGTDWTFEVATDQLQDFELTVIANSTQSDHSVSCEVSDGEDRTLVETHGGGEVTCYPLPKEETVLP